MKVFIKKWFKTRSLEHYLLKMRVTIAEYEQENWILSKAALGECQENSFIRSDKLLRKIKRYDRLIALMSRNGNDYYAPLRKLS